MTKPHTTHIHRSRRFFPPGIYFRVVERCLVLFRRREGNAYDALSLTNETVSLCASAPLRETISRATDSLGRPSGFSLDGTYAVAYGYDAYGRFASVSASHFELPTSHFTYSYLPGSHLLSGMVASTGFSWSRTYEPHRDLVTSVENTFGETVISRYDYANDALGRRTAIARSGTAFSNPAFDRYGYNARSEVTGAQRYHGTNPADTSRPYGGRGFGYAYDPIGNRTSATETIGGETLAKTYTANALNQYTAIANPAFAGLRGEAVSNAVVTVNGDAVQSDAVPSGTIPWHFALAADNAAGPDFPLAEIVAVVNPPGTNTPDSVETKSGHLYAPPQAETLAYDDDGNLVSDGRWQYTWNGENRLVKAEELVSPTNRPPYVVAYAYDHQGRMTWKTVAPLNAPPLKTIRYLWDDYNIVTEHVISDSGTNITYNVCGLDLSGTLQGAGGIGGLLSVSVAGGGDFLPTYDANGNITEYVATNGLVAAHYEYGPFGETVVQSGNLADAFTHRFSTKPWCKVTGLSEYELRKYNPRLGRWMSRDPIVEDGFRVWLLRKPIYTALRGLQKSHGLYRYAANSSIQESDYLGLAIIYGPDYDVDASDQCCTEEKDTWDAEGFASPADCAADCYSKFGGWIATGGSVLGSICGASTNPKIKLVCSIIGMATGAYAASLAAAGCPVACEMNQCVTFKLPSVYFTIEGWFPWTKKCVKKWKCPKVVHTTP